MKKLFSVIISVLLIITTTVTVFATSNLENNAPLTTANVDAEIPDDEDNLVFEEFDDETDDTSGEEQSGTIKFETSTNAEEKIEEKIIRLNIAVISKNITFTLVNEKTKETYDVSLSRENKYRMNENVQPGVYKIENFKNNNEKLIVELQSDTVEVKEDTGEIIVNATETAKVKTFKEMLKDDMIFIILLVGFVIALFVVRKKNGEKMFPMGDKLREKIQKKNTPSE